MAVFFFGWVHGLLWVDWSHLCRKVDRWDPRDFAIDRSVSSVAEPCRLLSRGYRLIGGSPPVFCLFPLALAVWRGAIESLGSWMKLSIAPELSLLTFQHGKFNIRHHSCWRYDATRLALSTRDRSSACATRDLLWRLWPSQPVPGKPRLCRVLFLHVLRASP